MALFCNNKLCESVDCEWRDDGTKQIIDGDYVGDFAPTCKRMSDTPFQFEINELDRAVKKAIADTQEHELPASFCVA